MQEQAIATITKIQSLTLTKNLLLATIGSIAYVRMLFPEDNFLTKGLDGIAVKTLKQNASIEANTLLDWMEKGVFDAIQKQYLHQLVFGIYLDPENPLDLVEQYQFEFSYPDKDSYNFTVSKESTPLLKDITNSTRQMIRKLLVLTQSLEPLPENAFITMRLFYHQHTPIDYEPPMFKAGQETLPINVSPVQLGSVETAHHEITLQVVTRSKQTHEEVEADMIPASQDMELSQRPAFPSEYPQYAEQPSEFLDKSASVATQIVESPKKPAIEPEKVNALFAFVPESQPVDMHVDQHDTIMDSQRVDEKHVGCACNSPSEEFLVKCTACSIYFHYPCYGYTSPTDPRLGQFLCYDCDTKTMIPREDFVVLSQRRLTLFALQRDGGSATVRHVCSITNLSTKVSQQVLKYLKGSGVIVQEGKKWVVGDCTAFFCTDLNYLDEQVRTSRDSGVGIKYQDSIESGFVVPKSNSAKKRKVSVVQQDLAVL